MVLQTATQLSSFLVSLEPILLSFLTLVVPALGFWIVAQLKVNYAASEKNAEKIDRIAQVSDNTHTLVNNAMGAQLKLNATTTQALANATHESDAHCGCGSRGEGALGASREAINHGPDSRR
jgi:hypothetical protein